MQANQRGTIANSLEQLIPFVDWAERLGLRRVLVTVVKYSIRDYQKFISPKKGFSCAHRKLHNGASCSTYFYQAVETYGLVQAVPMFQQRLEECREAHLVLKAIDEVNEPEPETEDLKEKESNEKKPDSSEQSNESVDWCNTGCGNINFPDCGTCDFNHNGTLDQGDCSSLSQCDGVDVGGCDVGGCDCNF